MDQRATTEAELYERLFPGRPLPYWLGEALRAPVRDIPTVEDYEREQGLIGVPTEEQSSREVGQGTLDYLTMAHGLANLLKSGGAGVQELMGKGRGVETFGKEMMDTSRRAQQPWQQKARDAERDLPMEIKPDLAAASGEVTQGRQSYRDEFASRMPPAVQPRWTPGASRPADAVSQDVVRVPIEAGGTRAVNAFKLGEPVALPGDRQAQYVVMPSDTSAAGQAPMWTIQLHDGERIHYVQTVGTVGEALAKARQLQNRLALAAKDMGEVSRQGIQEPRAIRLPWERSTGPYGGDPEAWRERLLSPPPQSGRWAQ